MKIGSPAQLGARLDRGLAWRKKELTQFKLLADSSPSQQIARMLHRAGIALMYAHWEGYVKDSSKLYLTYLSSSQLDLGKIKSCFVAIAIRGEIKTASLAKKNSLHAGLVDYLRSMDAPPPKMKKLPVARAVSTRSNLKAAVLREITATLGLDYSPFELKENAVINRLATFRNTIAHGGGLPIDPPDYNALHTETIGLMDAYKDLIQDAADNSRHLK